MTHLLAAAWLCVLSVRPAAAQNFLEGVVSLNLTMTKEETASLAIRRRRWLSRPRDGLGRTVRLTPWRPHTAPRASAATSR
jgi:hypothetical protein